MTRTTIVTKSIVASAIDSRAESKYAESAVFHVPRDENDLSQGFNHITWKQFANAINHAAWWLESNVGPKTSDKFEVFAYQGPNDLRYPILAVAAAKVGKQV